MSSTSTSVLSVGTLPCQDYFVGGLMSVLCLMQRNDMVEYFGEQLEGFCFSANGWVQSYGSRCVKPPIIFGDVSRPKAMTVFWSQYAQSVPSVPWRACSLAQLQSSTGPLLGMTSPGTGNHLCIFTVNHASYLLLGHFSGIHFCSSFPMEMSRCNAYLVGLSTKNYRMCIISPCTWYWKKFCLKQQLSLLENCRSETCYQIALAIKDEVEDLEAGGITVRLLCDLCIPDFGLI